MENRTEFKGKFVLVTGASSGIGFQIAKDFISRGAYVAAHYCSGRKGAEKLLRFAGKGKCAVFQADFSSAGSVKKLWSSLLAWSRGRIDILVNNAGEVYDPAPIDDLTETAWDRTFQVNVRAPFFLSRTALKVMSKNREGRIINISSIGVKFGGGATTAHYSASKAALEAVGRSIAKAGAPFNVLVNTVRPGVTDTPLHRKARKADMDRRVALIPLKRMARPEEISAAVIFLAGAGGSYITNTVMDVAGGE